MPFLEAACHGLPIIATNHSAHTEILQVSGVPKFIRADFMIKEVPKHLVDNVIIPEGARWAFVPTEEIVHTLQRFAKSGGDVKPREMAAELKEKIRARFSTLAMVKEMYANLLEASPKLFDPENLEE